MALELLSSLLEFALGILIRPTFWLEMLSFGLGDGSQDVQEWPSGYTDDRTNYLVL